MWFAKILRFLSRLIDGIVYWAVDMVYRLFIMISETGIFTPGTIRTFAGRIYILLGVFMLFKVSFSLITYILNPDSLTDKSKGVGKLLTNFFVVLIGIVAVPYVFQAAFSLQSIMLKENVIGNLVMGLDAKISTNSENYVEQGGKLMAFTTLSAFIRLNEEIVGQDCSDEPVIAKLNSDGAPLLENGKIQYKINDECPGDIMNTEVDKGAGGGTIEQVLIDAYTNNNIKRFTGTDLTNLTTNTNEGEKFIFNYNFIISWLAGGFLAYILLLFCIDIATRSVKLGFLQLIAPIPIISYIDPKGGKDGIFKKWTSQCIKTYLDLFVRLVAIYFAIFIISEIINGRMYNIVTGERTTNIFVIVFIILGTLMFAKQLPGLISDITGVKLDGGFTMSARNKLQQVPLAGWAGTQLSGRTAGAIEAFKNDQTGHKWRALRNGWAGAGRALKDKVPIMGSKAGSVGVRGAQIGREAGFEIATGNKFQKRVPVSNRHKRKIEEEISNLKSSVRSPLQSELNQVGLQKQQVANDYKRLTEMLGNASDPEQRTKIEKAMEKAQANYQALSTKEVKISSDIKTVNDQIKDLEKAYNIDESTTEKMEKVKANATNISNYGGDIETIDFGQFSSSTTSGSDTVGGVKVSSPNKNGGERTTESGIILGSNIRTDK